MNDRAEVCPLSCEVMFQPVSRQLQPGFRFLRFPLPAAPTAFLTVRLPFPAALRAYPVPHKSLSGSDPSYSPAAHRPWWLTSEETTPCCIPFGQACQHVWLVNGYDVYQRFTYVDRCRSSLAPHRPRAGRFHVASRLSVPDARWLHCSRSFTPSRCQLRMSG